MDKRIKTGGRTKGTPNKKTVWLRESLELVDLHWEEEFASAVNTKDYKLIELLISMLPYLSPKIKEKELLHSPEEDSEDLSTASTEELLSLVKRN